MNPMNPKGTTSVRQVCFAVGILTVLLLEQVHGRGLRAPSANGVEADSKPTPIEPPLIPDERFATLTACEDPRRLGQTLLRTMAVAYIAIPALLLLAR